MKFRAEDIVNALREQIAGYREKVDVSHVGRVREVGDGIARITGLSDVMAGEMLEFQHGEIGQALNLEEECIGAVIYGSCEHVKAGQLVRSTGCLLEVPVGEGMLGRVIDPLGRPLDGGQPIEAAQSRPVEMPAPGIAARQPVSEPLHTGIKAIDSMIPIGRGQRELIIGDRKTGKTAIAIDAILSQKDTGVLCVYVAVGQKESTVAGIFDTLRSRGAMEHTIVVSASSSDPAPLQYVAPYSGCAIAEHFMYQGRHTLVVYDDLTKQAAAYRQISLLLRRPPGREAYPGDIFYLHSRLLERACKLAETYAIVPKDAPEGAAAADGQTYDGVPGLRAARRKLGEMGEDRFEIRKTPGTGGSMTALPICETQEGQVEAYIPTNLISITDGQIYLEPSLFFSGVRPAVNVGISVSRVGYKAASRGMKEVAKSLRLDLAAYRELETFAQLGMELDASAQERLDRGARMIKVLTQPQYRPEPVADQIIEIFAGTRGYLDDIAVDDVPGFQKGLLDYIRREQAEFYEELSGDLDLPADRAGRLGFIIEDYKRWQRSQASRQPARQGA